MKKIAKLSLVAAIAVSGLTSANATALEEAIKGVDISGSAVYRYDDREDTNTTNNSYKIAVNLKSAINDDLTFNTRTIVGSGVDMVALPTNTRDGNADVSVSQANFAYTGIMNTTVIAGKQAVPSPFAVQVDAAGDEDTGTGITAISNLGVVTVAGTYLNQTNLGGTAGQDIAGLGLMADIGPVSLDGWYLAAIESSNAKDDAASLYTVGAKAKVEIVDLTARYSAVDASAAGIETESIWKVGAKAKVGIVTASLDYGQSSDSDKAYNGLVGGVTGDADADVNLQAWRLNLNNNDAELTKFTVGVDVLADLNLSATYANLELGDTSSEDTEYYGQATYKMGKNFMTYARMGETQVGKKEDTRGRLHVQYTF